MTYEEIHYLFAHSPCASNLKETNLSILLRTKRDDNTASTSNVYALQSTINDHRRFHPLDMLTSILLRRYLNKQLPRKLTKIRTVGTIQVNRISVMTVYHRV
jgi:hypothetical protein